MLAVMSLPQQHKRNSRNRYSQMKDNGIIIRQIINKKTNLKYLRVEQETIKSNKGVL